MKSSPQRILVIGAGSIGQKHLATIKAVYPECKTLLVSAREQKISQVAYVDEYHHNIKDALATKIDFAIVASPSNLHQSHCLQLIAAKIPMLTEKPLANNAENAAIILDASQRHNSMIRVGYCLRFLPAVHYIHQLLATKQLGNLVTISAKVAQYLPDWRPNTDYRHNVSGQKALGGGVLLELSHELDLLTYLFGELRFQQGLITTSDALSIDVEDSAHLLLSRGQQTAINVELNFVQQFTQRYLIITGTLASLHWDLLTNQVMVYGSDNIDEYKAEPNWKNSDIYPLQLKSFVAALNGEDTINATVEQAYAVNQLIDHCKQEAHWLSGTKS